MIEIEKHSSGGEEAGRWMVGTLSLDRWPGRRSLLAFVFVVFFFVGVVVVFVASIALIWRRGGWLVALSLDRWPGRGSLLALPHSMASSPDPPPRETDRAVEGGR